MKKSIIPVSIPSNLISKSLKENDKRLWVCFNLVSILESPLKDGMMYGFWTSDEHENSIYIVCLNSWVQFEDEWDFYEFFFALSKVVWLKFATVIDKEMPPDESITEFGYTDKEIKSQNHNPGEEWSIFFERKVERKYMDGVALPYFVLKIDLKNKDEVISSLYKLIDEYLDYFFKKDSSGSPEELPFKKQRNIVFNAILNIYEATGYTDFTLQQRAFFRHTWFHFNHSLLWFWRTGYIEILEANNHNADDFSSEEDDGAGHFYKYKGVEYPNNAHKVRLSETLIKILEGMWEVKNTILDKIFDEDYKRISITRKHWEFHMMEGEKEIEVGNTKFVDLQKQYPYGEISAVNHWGKAKKYKVKEKIKLDNESTKNKQ